MNDYYSLRVNITPCSEDITDLAAAFLADAGYESFEPDETGLTAYIPAPNFDKQQAEEALAEMPFDCRIQLEETFVEGKDWNEEWEKNYFQPIVVGNKCVIHSTFHHDIPKAEYDIVIDPKMAFGTGHHFTTRLMISYILDLKMENKSLIDMGTGTGILAILASMRGASKVTGIEIDEPAWQNAKENVRINNTDIEMLLGDASQLDNVEQADYFLANINRNVILADLPKYAARLKPTGQMMLSGFYLQDIEVIAAKAKECGLELREERTEQSPQNGDIWASVRLSF